MKRKSPRREEQRLLGIVVAIVIITTLYFARDVFIPLALAWLFSLVLAPIVALLERAKFPRILAISVVGVVLVGVMGLIGWETSQQFLDLTNQLPKYKSTLLEKIHSIKGSSSQTLNKATDTVKELSKEIEAVTPGLVLPSERKKTAPAPGSSPSRPLAVELVPPANPLESVENMLGPLANAGVVAIFTIFILIGREDLRNRFIRLAGGGRLNVMTQALDEATRRINRYLLLQTVVNSFYGLIIGLVLHLMGIPNAALWGLNAAVLRFLPYVGPPMAAILPIALSLAIFPGWQHALLTAALFLVLELIVANVIEPLLYGSHIGLSPLAILVAAVFWTFIWGFPGLVLATPLTVCLVVMGRYVPSLSFLNVLLGDEPVLTPQAHYYQRLLANDQNEAREVLELYLKDKSLEELYNDVVIPALSLAEQDRHRDELDEETQNFIYQSTREILEELTDPVLNKNDVASSHDSFTTSHGLDEGNTRVRVLCIPARDEADDVVAILLSRLLEKRGFSAESIPIGSVAEMLSKIDDFKPEVVCISALPPFAINHARTMYLKLRSLTPHLHLVVCLWHLESDAQKVAVRLKLDGDHGIVTTLPQVLQHIEHRAEQMRSLSELRG